MHYHPSYLEYLRENEGLPHECRTCYDGPVWEDDPEDIIAYEQKEYRRLHPDRFWYRKFENKKHKRIKKKKK